MPIAYSDYTSRLERLLEICKNLSSNLELEPLLHSIIESAAELTYSESGSILVLDEENNFLKFLAAPWYMMETLKTISVPLDNSVAGWVFTNGQPMAIQHAEKDERIYRLVDRQLTDSTTSILAVPLVSKGEVIGVMECINKSNNAQYTEEDVTIVETLAAQAAVAIQNNWLLDETQSAYEKTMQLDRMKSDFMAIVSHELRTPLGLVLGHSSLLMDTASEEQKQDLMVIANSANRMKEIIEQFSDSDSLEQDLAELRRQRLSVSLLVKEVVDSFRELAESRNIGLIIDLPDADMVVEGDMDKIGIALRNLIQNALTFTNEGGKIKVKGEVVPGYAKITVMDNGIGIPAEEMDKIFTRFYQVEKHLTRKHGGVGLGLSIAKEMVELHGGTIEVESVEGMGSRFSMKLPASAAQASAAQKVFQTGPLAGKTATSAVKVVTGSLGRAPISPAMPVKPVTGNLKPRTDLSDVVPPEEPV
jgi:signal transduction histidine kinase